jgi:hypothetical protein
MIIICDFYEDLSLFILMEVYTKKILPPERRRKKGVQIVRRLEVKIGIQTLYLNFYI